MAKTAKKNTNKKATTSKAAQTPNSAPVVDPKAQAKAEREAARKAAREEAAAAKRAKAQAKAAEKAAKEKAAAEKRAARKASTRVAVFEKIVSGTVAKTKKQIQEEMLKIYGGSKAEADFQVDVYCRLLLQLGHMVKGKDDVLIYHPTKKA